MFLDIPKGGIAIKRYLLVLTMVLMMAIFAGCGSSGDKKEVPAAGEAIGNIVSNTTTSNGAQNSTDSTLQTGTAAEATPDTSADNTTTGLPGSDEQLLQSASVDLDGDGENEQVEAIQVTPKDGNDTSEEIEGILRIKSVSGTVQTPFWRKNEGLTGLISSIQFEDLDGDGAKDIFVIIPDNGAAFSLSNYFIYSYKKKLSYSFTSDTNLVDFIDGFHFRYKSGNLLSLENDQYGFSADLSIEYQQGDPQSTDEYMSEYEQRAWIDPVSVDISDDSRLALVRATDGSRQIKVPLPVFGLATVDMIGEIDLFFAVDSSFTPVLKRFEVLDFNGKEKKKTGSFEMK